jgi:hypothetical protein
MLFSTQYNCFIPVQGLHIYKHSFLLPILSCIYTSIAERPLLAPTQAFWEKGSLFAKYCILLSIAHLLMVARLSRRSLDSRQNRQCWRKILQSQNIEVDFPLRLGFLYHHRGFGAV